MTVDKFNVVRILASSRSKSAAAPHPPVIVSIFFCIAASWSFSV